MKDVHSNNVDSVPLNNRYLCLSSPCIVLHCSSVIPPFLTLSVIPPHCSPLFFGYIDPFTFHFYKWTIYYIIELYILLKVLPFKILYFLALTYCNTSPSSAYIPSLFSWSPKVHLSWQRPCLMSLNEFLKWISCIPYGNN
jgi:hypothetical protein